MAQEVYGRQSWMTLTREDQGYSTAPTVPESPHIPILEGADDVGYTAEFTPRATATLRGLHGIDHFNAAAGGSLQFHGQYNQICRALKSLMGTVETDQSVNHATSYNTYLAAADTVDSMLLNIYRGPNFFQYAGTVCNNLVLSMNSTGHMLLNYGVLCEAEARSTHAVVYAKDTFLPIKWAHITSASWGSTVLTNALRSFTINVNRNLDEAHFVSGLVGRGAKPPVRGPFEVTGSFEIDWNALLFYVGTPEGILQDSMYTQTEKVITIKFNNGGSGAGEHEFQIYIPAALVDPSSRALVETKGLKPHTVTFTASAADIAADTLGQLNVSDGGNAAFTDSPIAFYHGGLENHGTTW